MALDLKAVLRLEDKWSAPMRKAVKQTEKLSNTTKKTSGTFSKMTKTMDKAMLGVAGTAVAAFGTVGVAAINAGNDAQQAQKTLIAGTGAQGEALDGLMESYRKVGSQVPQDLGLVAQAVADLNTLTGETGSALESTTKAVLDSSRLMGESGVENVNAFGRALNQWQIPAAKGEETAAKLFKVAQDTGVGFGELSGQLTEYGSVLQNAGFTAEEAASLFGNLSKEGLSVSRIMPGLNMAFRNWASEGKNVQDELGNVITRMKDASDGTEALSIATDAFGAEGAQRLVTAVRNGTLSLEDLGGGLNGAVENLEEANNSSKTFGELWAEAMNVANTSLQPLGTALLEVAQDYMPQLRDAAQTMGDYLKTNMPQIKQSIEEFANTAGSVIDNVIEKATKFYNFIRDNWGAIKTTVITLGATFIALRATMAAMTIISTISKLWTTFKGVIAAVRTAQLFLNAAMLANPISAIIAGIAALILIGIYLWRNWDTGREAVKKLWGAIKTAFGNIGSWIADSMSFAKDAVVAGFKFIYNGAKSRIKSLLSTVKSIFTSIRDWISDKVTAAKDKLVGAFETARDKVSSALENAKEAVGNFFDPLLDFIGKAKGAWDSFTGALSKFKMPAGVGKIASGVGNFVGGLIPGNYHGLDSVPYDGYTTRLHKGETVLPREEAKAYREGKSGGGDVHVNINGDWSVSSRADADYIIDELTQKIKSSVNGGGLSHARAKAGTGVVY
ncbi:phage tail tape measure protein [Bacillus piscicola]|uniref:phage tail tape measure protein n=1 Tax=Bacillus piscicola TaxID=1632684 RepID=UPI001F09D3E6|nr:phage tail tape measure protein [Bacillus piscicola]